MTQIIGQGGSGGDLDIVLTSDGPLNDGRAKNVLSPLDYSKLPETASMPKNLLDPKSGGNLAITTSQFAYGLAYNSAILAKDNLPAPTSIKDMLNPIYAPVLGIYTPPFPGAISQIAIINKILGGPANDLTTGINALAHLKAAEEVSNSGQIDNDFAAGKVGMYFAASATVQTSVDAGLPAKMVYDPIYGTGIYAVIPKDPPHPAAACEFMNWLASVDGQNTLQQVNGNLPTRTAGVTIRPGTVMSEIAGQPVLSYPDLIATAPTTEAITEQWNQARAGH
jgi:spermidine/putrescine-binding protein